MKKLSLTLFTSLLVVCGLFAQNANVQVIHNSPDALVSTIDIYVNGSLAFDDFSFREATPFTPVPAGTAVIGLAPSSSQSYADTLGTITLPGLQANVNYVLLATGLLDTASYPSNPEGIARNFQLLGVGGAQVASTSGNVSLLVAHGAPDAPSVDVNLLALNQTPIGTIDTIPYAGFSSQGGNPAYLTLPANDILVNLSATYSGTNIATYYAPLSAFDGAAGVVFASGFVDAQQSNSFGLYLALPDGTVIKIPQIGSAAQIIHNSADPAAEVVDIYLVEQLTGNNGVIGFLDDMAFRSASVYLPFPSEVPFKVYVAPSNSTSPADSIASFEFPSGLDLGSLYSIVASGVLTPGDFASNPEGASTAFELFVYDQAKAQATPITNVDVLAFHGATDAPTVDIDIRELAGTEIDNIAYGEFSPNGYASFAPANVTVDVNDESGTTTVASFTAAISSAASAAVTVFASGFLDSTANQNGASFGLFAALPLNIADPNALYATVLPLPKLETTGISLVEGDVFNELTLFPNPSSDFLRVNYNLKESTDFSIRMVDASGKMISNRDLGRVSSGSNNVEFNVSDLASGTYFLQMILNNEGFIVKPVIVGKK